MQAVYTQIEMFARAPVPVLVLGETGTGKSLAAAAIHELDPRSATFEVANCGALPESLIDSEVFGHVRGAFTGAHQKHHGLIWRANGGILFLDEVGELPTFTQAKLLHCIDTGEFRPVGGERIRRSDFRLVAATNRDLAAMVEAGEFRDDLRYRLGTAVIRLPPLRARPEDIAPLSEMFLRRFRRRLAGHGPLGFTDPGLARLVRFGWPGNVRQLRHVVEAAATLAGNAYIDPGMVGAVLRDDAEIEEGVPTLREAIADAEREAIRAAIRAANGNREHAAKLLDVSPATLYRRLRDLREGADQLRVIDSQD